MQFESVMALARSMPTSGLAPVVYFLLGKIRSPSLHAATMLPVKLQEDHLLWPRIESMLPDDEQLLPAARQR
jgi:hypothetical protein